jgi:hypothetical protein
MGFVSEAFNTTALTLSPSAAFDALVFIDTLTPVRAPAPR